MDKFFIKGGKKLEGEVEVSGAKNSSLPIMAASILVPGTTILHNIPDVSDIRRMKELLEFIGAKIKFEDGTMLIDTTEIKTAKAPYEIVSKMRASYYVLGSLIGRTGEAEISFPGGCAIGPRPIDLHINGLRKLGVDIKIEHGYIKAKVKKLKGTSLLLEGPKGPSVGATINVMLSAVVSEGTTVINGAAAEPEVVDTGNFLKKMGAKISGLGTHIITIEGVKRLKPVEYAVIPDRIEAGTYMVAGAITGGDIVIKGAKHEHLISVITELRESGARVDLYEDRIRVRRKREIKPLTISTSPYPGFPTDMQAQFMAYLTLAKGTSIIKENIFENRFMQALELSRMGASIKIEGNVAIIEGVKKLTGAEVMASDLRASAALILAGLVAEGETVITRVYHIDRGYEKIEKKLKKLGASIERIKT